MDGLSATAQILYPSGKAIEVFSLSDNSDIASDFKEKALNKSNSQYKSYWSKLIFTGKGKPPRQIKSEDEMINVIK